MSHTKVVVDTNVVKKLTDAKGLTSIFDDKAVKVKTVTTVNGPGCDTPFVNGADFPPFGDLENSPTCGTPSVAICHAPTFGR